MKKILSSRSMGRLIAGALLVWVCFAGYQYLMRTIHENAFLKKVVVRLSADFRVAEVLVMGVQYDEKTQKTSTTIKFLEYDSSDQPLQLRYFTFFGNIIQFQALMIRFEDRLIRRDDALKGKSAYLFWKVFVLDGANTQEFVITEAHSIPDGYKLANLEDPFEQRIWNKFWDYALDPAQAQKVGIKNAQIEAPGTMFVPGILYTIRIEHDGGLRIDSSPISPILQGETIPQV